MLAETARPTPAVESPAATEKEALEIAKLRLEADKLSAEAAKLRRDRFFAPWLLAAQVFGSLSILTTAFLALYFFQRPQLQQMESARISNEQLQLDNYVLAIQKFENDNDKVRAFEVLASQWIQYPYLADLARSTKVIVESKRAASDCSASDTQVANISASIRSIDTRTSHINTLKNVMSVADRFDSEMAALQTQRKALVDQLAIVQDKRKQDRCPP